MIDNLFSQAIDENVAWFDVILAFIENNYGFSTAVVFDKILNKSKTVKVFQGEGFFARVSEQQIHVLSISMDKNGDKDLQLVFTEIWVGDTYFNQVKHNMVKVIHAMLNDEHYIIETLAATFDHPIYDRPSDEK